MADKLCKISPFEDITCHSPSADEIIRFLGQYGIRNLAYGDVGQNPGYIFRGELAFKSPLSSSLEREWFKRNIGKESCTITDLLDLEREILEEFIQEATVICDIAGKHGHPFDKKPEEDVFWWLSFKQHYGGKTRLLDFTKDIRLALFFALQSFCQRQNADQRKEGLYIYCFPCRNLRNPRDVEANKSPFAHADRDIDMNLAFGGQLNLNCMKRHKPTYNEHYSADKQKQSFGWDRSFYCNPRLSFQKGMFVYPFSEEPQIQKGGDSWLMQCFLQNLKDPFNLRSVKDQLSAIRIQIPQEAVEPLLTHIQDILGLTPARVYLDYDKISDPLEILK